MSVSPSPAELRAALARVPADPAADAPLHRQIERGLEALLGRQLPAGARLPAETELAALWGVARGTVRRALGSLAERGLLQRAPGRGTRVAPLPIEQYLGVLTSFSEDMRARGFEPGSHLLSLERVPAPPALQKIFHCGPQPLWRLRRLRCADGAPVALETSHIPAHLLDPLALEASAGASLYAVFRRAGVRLGSAVQWVEAVNAGPEETELLGLAPGAACLRQERIVCDPQGRVVEVVTSTYRGDRFRLQVELRAP